MMSKRLGKNGNVIQTSRFTLNEGCLAEGKNMTTMIRQGMAN